MKKTSLILLSMLLLSSVLSAQESIMFDKQFIFDNHGSYPKDLKQTPDGGYICGGGIGFSMYDERYLLFKTDSLGDLEWYKYSDSSAVHSTLYAVDITKTGGYVGIGSTQDNEDWHNSGAIVMYDSLGDTLWTKQYAFEHPSIDGLYSKITFYDGLFTSDNALIAAGGIIDDDNLGSDPNPIVVKTNIIGDTLWTWRLYNTDNTIVINSIAETQAGDYVAVGRADMPILSENKTYAPQRGFIVKLSSDGELIYLKEWTDIEFNYFNDLAINNNGELVISGTYFHHPPEYPDDETFGFVLKTDSLGNTIFYNPINYGKALGSFSICLGNSGEIVCLSEVLPPLSNDWDQDVYLQKYTNSGELVWTKIIGEKEVVNWPYSVIPTKDNGFAFCGLYSTDTQNYSWLVKTDSLGNGVYSDGWIDTVEPNRVDNEFSIYPNPAYQYFSISSLADFQIKEIIIYDVNGKIVKAQKAVNFPIDISDLKNGIYIIKLSVNDKIIRKILIVEH